MNLVNVKLNQDELEKIANHYVLFSGGADSTLILLQLAWAYNRSNSVKQINTIELTEHTNLFTPVTKAQNKAKDKIIKMIEDKYKLKINRIYVKTEIKHLDTGYLLWDLKTNYTFGGHIPMLTGTILNAIASIAPDSALHVGLISDDENAYLKASYMKETIETGMYIFNRGNVTVNFPLIDYGKGFIMNVMDDNELIDIISYCESPKYDSKKKIYAPCGNCGSCKTLVENYIEYHGNPINLKHNPYEIPNIEDKKEKELIDPIEGKRKKKPKTKKQTVKNTKK